MRRSWRALLALALAVLGLSLWGLQVFGPKQRHVPTLPARSVDSTARVSNEQPVLRRKPVVPPRASVRPAPPASQTSSECEPYVNKDCYAGNVHWFDGCGNVLDLDTDCGDGFCRSGSCVDRDWTELCVEPPEGRCDGDRVVYCDSGKTAVVDCAAKNQECRVGAEGAICVAIDPELGCEGEPARCDEELLVQCIAGSLQQTDCSLLGGSCVEVSGRASCVQPVPQSATERDCGACGCPPEPQNVAELCNGEDDDENGFIDDGIACGPVVVDALVGPGEHGERLLATPQLEAELEFTNQLFEASGSQIRFVLGTVEDLALPEPESPSFEQLLPLLDSPESPGESGTFRVRLVIAQRLLEGEVPKLGVAFPFVTHGCGQILKPGGQRFDRSLIAVAEDRVRTTLAHELGHLLGLCHTHDQDHPITVPVAQEAEAEPCGEPCSYGGDAICDTPPDHEECSYEPHSCEARCPGGERPDTRNLMSYYHACRSVFSSDQVQLMEHTLALRRAWFQCRNNSCGCHPLEAPCPTGMSCRPLQGMPQRFVCGMDGPSVPGGPCQASQDCSAHSLCLAAGTRSRCVRPCVDSALGCTCIPVGTGELSVCREDIAADQDRGRESGDAE